MNENDIKAARGEVPYRVPPATRAGVIKMARVMAGLLAFVALAFGWACFRYWS